MQIIINIINKYKKLRPLAKIILWLVVAMLVLYIFALPRNLFDSPRSTVIFSTEGELLGARIAKDGQWRFPNSDSIPEKFTQAIITFEDRRFRYHPGVDPLAMARAIRTNIGQKRVVSGASTITMQTIRLMRGKTNRTVWQKMIEAILATRLELTHSKNTILKLYSSNAPFGGNVVGLEAAAWRYFGRSAHELSWAESATLAVLPNSPSMINVGRNRELLKTKRDGLLHDMFTRGVIDHQTYELSTEEPIPAAPLPLPMIAPHLLDRTAREHPQQATRTTIEYGLQKMVNEVVAKHSAIHRSNYVYNMATVVVHVPSGRVVSYVGNVFTPDDPTRGTSVDIVTARRSSGSILKPLLFAAMMDDGNILPATLIADTPFRLNGFSPSNFNKTYDGAVPAHRSMERSLNIPTVRMLQEYGVEKFHALLCNLGFSTITKPASHYGLTLVLGGAEISLWDACSVYASLAEQLNNQAEPNRKYHSLNLYPHTQNICNHKTEIENGALWITLDALQNVNRPEEEMGWQHFSSSRRVAWKTGTSYGNRDAWSIGITPEYVVGVWVGNADGEGRPAMTGVGYASPVMFDIFNLLPRTSWFSMPEMDLRHVEVCSKSGHLASALCPERDSIWISPRGVETPQCPYHITVNLSPDLRYRVNSDCEQVSNIVQQVWFVLPPAQEWFYRQHNADYKTLPPLHPNFSSNNLTAKEMEIIYPLWGTKLIPTRGLNGEEQGVVFHAVHSNPKAEIFWHVDDKFVGSTSGEHKIRWRECPSGKHTLTIVDGQGASMKTIFEVETSSQK